jgi:endonuclease YncB( thermonuclease family)
VIALAFILNLTGALVVDGDILKLDGQRYRLWGIDAPESSELGGPASTQTLRRIIGNQPLRCAGHRSL